MSRARWGCSGPWKGPGCWRGSRERPVADDAGRGQELRGQPGPGRGVARARGGRGPGAPGRGRRGQEHADEGPERRVPARLRSDGPRRPSLRAARAEGCPGPGRGDDLPSAEHRRIVSEALATLDHPDIRLEARAGSLSVGAQQLIEVARALVSNARVIVFDEPTSSLTERDATRLFEVIGRLRARGLAIVYISHFLEEVRRIPQSYTVLRDGRTAASGPMAGTELAPIIPMMVAREPTGRFP